MIEKPGGNISHLLYIQLMKIEEAIVYVMVKHNGGMTTDQIADAINHEGLHQRKDGLPVTSKQVYATICRFPETFTKEAGRIMLLCSKYDSHPMQILLAR